MQTEPIYVTETHDLGRIRISLKGEKWDGEILDTEVTIGGACLCWISWPERENFIKQLQKIVDTHSI